MHTCNNNNNNNNNNVKTNVIPISIEVNGAISESFRKCLTNIPGKHDIKTLQKTATWDTVHTLKTVRMLE